MKQMIAMVAALATAAVAGPAMAADPLPEAGRTSLGGGFGPSLGIEGTLSGPQLKVHFFDNMNGWRFWTPGSAPTDTYASAAPMEASKCLWGGPTMWCSGIQKFFPGVGYKGFAYAQTNNNGTTYSAYQHFSPTALLGRGLQDASGDRAVVELSNGQLFLSQFDSYNQTITPSSTLTPNLSTATNAIEGRPVIHDPYVAWQAMVGGVVQVKAFLFEPPPGALVLQQQVQDVPGLSEMSNGWVWFDHDNSVMNAFVGGAWDPGSVLYNPDDHGCARFSGLKGAEGDFMLVRGEDCDSWGQSALFALLPGYSGEPRVFFVGELSASAPQYEVYGRHIVYVDSSEEVVWVEADPSIFDDYGIFEPDEPNDNGDSEGGDVLTLIPGVVAKGRLHGGPTAAAGDDDRDFWYIHVEQDKCYKISSGLAGPGMMCDHNPYLADPVLTIIDYMEPKDPLAPFDTHTDGVIDGYGTSKCAIFEICEPGDHWLEVIGDHYQVQYASTGKLDYYLLATESP